MSPKQQRVLDILSILKQKDLPELDKIYASLTPGQQMTISPAAPKIVPPSQAKRTSTRSLRGIR